MRIKPSVEQRAKFLHHHFNMDKEQAVRQAIHELKRPSEIVMLCQVFDITLDDYVKSIIEKIWFCLTKKV